MALGLGFTTIDIDDFRKRSRTICQLLADSAIENDSTTHLALIHIIISSWIAEELPKEGMALNLASLAAAALELAGADLSPDERVKHRYRVAKKN